MSTPTPVPLPATPPRPSSPSRPSIPTSTSLPCHASLSSVPSLSSTQSSPSLTSNPLSPASSTTTSRSKNYHPYLIQTTSSSILTRSNSSPSQPVHALTSHRPSTSMCNVSKAAGVVDGNGNAVRGAEDEGEKGLRRTSMESPTPSHRPKRSGTMPMMSHLSHLNEMGQDRPPNEMNGPLNPKDWTPTELAQYLGYTLRTGGPDGNGQVLPLPLVEDIKTWVLRQRITGKAFLRGNSGGWATSTRPPPFLPLLLSLSRRVRRTSIQGQTRSDPLDHGPGSVLLEAEDEDNPTSEDHLTGVQRMANALESRDSASEASEDEGNPARLVPQWTGGSDSSVWEKWGLKKQNTGSSTGGAGGGEYGSPTRRVSSRSDKSFRLSSSPEKDEVTKTAPATLNGEDEGAGGTMKAPLPNLVRHQGEGGTDEPSPPPPYLSPVLGEETAASTFPSRLVTTPLLDVQKRSDRQSVTPTPDRLQRTDPWDLARDTPSKVIADGVDLATTDPYRVLRRGSVGRRAGGLRQTTLRGKLNASTHDDDKDADDAEYDSSDESRGMRKVTLRPNRSITESNSSTSPSAKSSREVELECQLVQVLERVKVLESRLEDDDFQTQKESRAGRLAETVGELPGYLFLVGFGVGAMVVRVLLGRRRV